MSSLVLEPPPTVSRMPSSGLDTDTVGDTVSRESGREVEKAMRNRVQVFVSGEGNGE